MSSSEEVSTWDFDGWGGDGGFGSGGSSFGSGGIGGFNLGLGGFDLGGVASDVGGPAYSPGTASNGLFGMSMTETLASGAGFTALLTGITTGVGTSFAISNAGGWAAATAAGNVGWAGVGTGLGSAFVGGLVVGSLLYNNSETVRDAAQWTVGAVIDTVDTAVALRDWAAGATVPYVIRYMVP
jgi:hypothetical protein